MPAGEGKTKNNMAGRVGPGFFYFSFFLFSFFLNWKDTTCTASVYASRSVQGRHERAVRENSQHARPPCGSRCWLLVGDNVMEGFQAPHKGEGLEEILRYGDIVRKPLPWFFPNRLPCRFARKSTSFAAFFERWCGQLKSKLSFSYAATPFSSVHHTPWKPHGSGGFPSHLGAHLSTWLSLCRVSKYRWVDRATYTVLNYFLGQFVRFS